MQEFNVESIFKIDSEHLFNEKAVELFHFQRNNNLVYKEFLQHINKYHLDPGTIEEIPFLPISFFKNHQVLCGDKFEEVFTSSGTGGIQSKHHVHSIEVYKDSYEKCFKLFYGNAKGYTFLCLLPSYLERTGSSLITMTEGLIKSSADPRSGFFLNDHESLASILNDLATENKKTMLIGVSYALLDFVESHEIGFENLIVMETGGMKGRKKEITRQELHQTLCKGFNAQNIHSEYGMTELLSQAYSISGGIFKTPPWMKALRRDSRDPLSVFKSKGSGALNLIDLANVYSCAFLASDDIGELYENGDFSVNGRLDNSDLRGCNLMLTENI